MQWLEIWYLSPGKRSYLERAGREDLIELAAPLQGILEDPDDQRAFPAELEGRGITSLETFLNHLYN